MSETKHTPGPWIEHSGMVWKDGPNVWPKGESVGIPIACMDRESGNGTMPTERDANARLIAAAPDLLEALGSMIHRFDHLALDSGKREAVKAGLAAIAKAKGTN